MFPLASFFAGLLPPKPPQQSLLAHAAAPPPPPPPPQRRVFLPELNEPLILDLSDGDSEVEIAPTRLRENTADKLKELERQKALLEAAIQKKILRRGLAQTKSGTSTSLESLASRSTISVEPPQSVPAIAETDSMLVEPLSAPAMNSQVASTPVTMDNQAILRSRIFKSQLDSTSRQLQRLQEETKSMMQELSDHKRDLVSAELSLANKATRANLLRAELKRLEKEVSDLEGSKRGVQSSIHQLESSLVNKSKEIDHVTGKLGNIRQSLQGLEQRNHIQSDRDQTTGDSAARSSNKRTAVSQNSDDAAKKRKVFSDVEVVDLTGLDVAVPLLTAVAKPVELVSAIPVEKVDSIASTVPATAPANISRRSGSPTTTKKEEYAALVERMESALANKRQHIEVISKMQAPPPAPEYDRIVQLIDEILRDRNWLESQSSTSTHEDTLHAESTDKSSTSKANKSSPTKSKDTRPPTSQPTKHPIAPPFHYQSPLTHFRSFQLLSRDTEKPAVDNSSASDSIKRKALNLSFNHKIDPTKVFCMFELMGGVCQDSECKSQHARDYTPNEMERVKQLLIQAAFFVSTMKLTLKQGTDGLALEEADTASTLLGTVRQNLLDMKQQRSPFDLNAIIQSIQKLIRIGPAMDNDSGPAMDG